MSQRVFLGGGPEGLLVFRACFGGQQWSTVSLLSVSLHSAGALQGVRQRAPSKGSCKRPLQRLLQRAPAKGSCNKAFQKNAIITYSENITKYNEKRQNVS